MSTESISDRREHLRSIGVTAVTALFGVGAALLSAELTDVAGDVDAAASDTLGLAIVLGAIAIQIVLLRASGIYDPEEFGPKHYLFIAFMTFSFWFVVFGIVLTGEAM